MKSTTLFFFGLTLLFLDLSLAAFARKHTQVFCQIHLHSDEDLHFTKTEKDLLCGESDSPAWSHLPPSQKSLFLRGFLQSRGYLTPQFRQDGAELQVDSGPLYQLDSFRVIGASEQMGWQKRRFLMGRTLDPDLLKEAINWSRRRLQTQGFPCADAEGRVVIEPRRIDVTVSPGAFATFSDYGSVGESDIPIETLDRFTAYINGDPFDIRLLELTSSRILREDLYLSAFFDIQCAPGEPPKIIRRLIPAERKLVSFGIGGDSQEGPLIRMNWKIARLSDKANSFETGVYLSQRKQSFEAKYKHHLSSDLKSRLQAIPSLTLRREEETDYETRTSQMGMALAYSWEESSFQPAVQVGPVLERTETLRGAGPSRLDSLRVLSEIGATSHLYEYYMQDPQVGWTATLNLSSQFESVISEETFHRLSFRHQKIWNLGHWDPPFLILSWRSSMGTFIAASARRAAAQIPINQKFFLGGDSDLRGFGRKTLPGNNRGYLSVFYNGFELRAGRWFDFNLQPLVLWDIAGAGDNVGTLDGPIFHSPGFGLRYPSPIGTVRVTVARGYVLESEGKARPPHDQLFFSFGKEF